MVIFFRHLPGNREGLAVGTGLRVGMVVSDVILAGAGGGGGVPHS